MNYEDFFHKATDNRPYPYQVRVAESAALPMLLNAPTGAGKTEAIVLAWLWRRLEHPEQTVHQSTPRRLVYCLPMRALVTQTHQRVEGWLGNLGLRDDVTLAMLMGGETVDDDWRRRPEKPAIIIGTQDMLLSRALNRGYAQSPYQWPIDFGLLNNDCLWALDEVQLMAAGLPTTTQLAAFRQTFETYGPCHTLWMSATIRPEWLRTVDFQAPTGEEILSLNDEDSSNERLKKRNQAVKTLSQFYGQQNPTSGQPYNLHEIARAIVEKRQTGKLTLAVFNTVARAQGVFAEVQRLNPEAELLLLHSRFRLEEREKLGKTLQSDPPAEGRIVVATQAVEAGVDIDARTLFTDLAPWPSLVQRFGRCNRKGCLDQAEVYWLDAPDSLLDGRGNAAAPYEADDLKRARERLLAREGKSVGPDHLPELDDKDNPPATAALRRRDLVGLFDTTADLSGNYLDVSRFVRGSEDTDVSVFWRNWEGEGNPPGDLEKPQPQELCRVRTGYVRQYLGVRGGPRQRRAWRWDYLDGAWDAVMANEVRPGQTLLLRAAAGGYTAERGWNPESREPVTSALEVKQGRQQESNDAEESNIDLDKWISLADHSRDVHREAERILRDLDLPDLSDLWETVATAAHYHDAGKAHSAFQKMLTSNLDGDERKKQFWAKRGSKVRPEPNERPRFRHEVGSALVLLQHAPLSLQGWQRDLAAYLAMAHHGKARLALRSLPGRGGRNPESEYLLGFHLPNSQGGKDCLPAADLGDGASFPKTTLDLSLAHIGVDANGEASWLERALALRDRLGPFRLAYLEALVRMADWRASDTEQKEANP